MFDPEQHILLHGTGEERRGDMQPAEGPRLQWTSVVRTQPCRNSSPKNRKSVIVIPSMPMEIQVKCIHAGDSQENVVALHQIDFENSIFSHQIRI